MHGKVRLVFAGEHFVCHQIQNLRKFGGVILTHGKDDGFANLTADRVAIRVLQKCFAEKLIGGVGEKALLELALFESFFLIFTLIVFEIYDETLFRQKLCGDFTAGIHDGWIDKVAIFNAIEQGIAEGGLAVLAAEGAVGVEQQTAFVSRGSLRVDFAFSNFLR